MSVQDFEGSALDRLSEVEGAIRQTNDLLRSFQDGLASDMATVVQYLGRIADALERLADKADPS